MGRRVYSVFEVNDYIKGVLDSEATLSSIYVKGEVSNYKLYPSGHHYFSIKDNSGSLKCVMFKYNALNLKFKIENGMKVTIHGNITVYPRDGIYQLYCLEIIPEGVGALALAYEQLKARLNAEGLFNHEHKKTLPAFPDRIVLLTSGSGAAVRDMIRILNQRWPLSKVLVYPVMVQGAASASEISSGIEYINKYRLADLIITGRGGGSTEDLWSFNEEIVARAIFNSEIPVISAVGHEPDVVISDYVADRRASTPSNGAEIAVPSQKDIRRRLVSISENNNAILEYHIMNKKHVLDKIAKMKAIMDPMYPVQLLRQDIDYYTEKNFNCVGACLLNKKSNLRELAGIINGSGPIPTLSRGYSISLKNGNTVRSVKQLNVNDVLDLVFVDGRAGCKVELLSSGELL